MQFENFIIDDKRRMLRMLRKHFFIRTWKIIQVFIFTKEHLRTPLVFLFFFIFDNQCLLFSHASYLIMLNQTEIIHALTIRSQAGSVKYLGNVEPIFGRHPADDRLIASKRNEISARRTDAANIRQQRSRIWQLVTNLFLCAECAGVNQCGQPVTM